MITRLHFTKQDIKLQLDERSNTFLCRKFRMLKKWATGNIYGIRKADALSLAFNHLFSLWVHRLSLFFMLCSELRYNGEENMHDSCPKEAWDLVTYR